MNTQLHADRSQTVVVHGQSLPWVPSPERGVERRLLERVGAEVALATSIVRYAPGSSFPRHTHGLGEEFLVLEGTFSDESGDFPAGAYVRNPPGSSHAPFSRDGCVIFVKLRQMRPDDSSTVRVRVAQREWRADRRSGLEHAQLHADADVRVELLRMPPGADLPARRVVGGEEILVVSGAVELPGRRPSTLDRWGWRRSSAQRQPAFTSAGGALLWRKQGHL